MSTLADLVIEAVVKYLAEAEGTGILYLVMGLLEEEVDHRGNQAFYCLDNGGRLVFDGVLKVLSEPVGHVSKQTSMKLKKHEAITGRRVFGYRQEVLVAQLLNKFPRYLR